MSRVRRDLESRVLAAAAKYPAVTITGPRQSGKSTLCRVLFPDKPHVSLEAHDTRAFAEDDPRGFLARYPDGAILDEIQRTPRLPSYLQQLIDDDPTPGRWILTGSQNLLLLDAVSQSLAGRTAILQLLPCSRREVLRFESHPTDLDSTLLAGGYPAIFDRHLDPDDWLGSYVATYVERDVRSIAKVGDLTTFQRFIELCAGRTGQLLNLSGLASDTGISQPTAKSWLSILETSFIVFRLPAFHANHRKRLVRMPKLHFHDTGLVCRLLGIRTVDHLHTHPLRGAIFETWMVSEILKHRTNAGERGGLSFYRDHAGVEADLVVERGSRRTVAEAKATMTASRSLFDGLGRLRSAFDDPAIDFAIVYGGEATQRRTDSRLIPWDQVHSEDWSQPPVDDVR
jgi:predicted AAA+ superfamily ATPase